MNHYTPALHVLPLEEATVHHGLGGVSTDLVWIFGGPAPEAYCKVRRDGSMGHYEETPKGTWQRLRALLEELACAPVEGENWLENWRKEMERPALGNSDALWCAWEAGTYALVDQPRTAERYIQMARAAMCEEGLAKGSPEEALWLEMKREREEELSAIEAERQGWYQEGMRVVDRASMEAAERRERAAAAMYDVVEWLSLDKAIKALQAMKGREVGA